MPKTAVVALGGNAFTRAGQTGTYEEQSRNALTMARSVLAIRRSGWNVVIVHGNGPQVGNLAIQQEEGRRLVPAQPLFSLGAMTQGEIGSLISLALRAGDADVAVAALISHVVVAPEDPAFGAPAKPIGPFFTRARAGELAAERGWTVGDDSGRGFRRLVPSPRPVEVVEAAAIKSLVAGGTIVIAGGGGGVPVAPGGPGLVGIEAVIDKDYVAGQLATSLAAQALVFVTDVPRLMLDFGLPTERALGEIDVAAAERYQRDSQFPAGSMGPKVHAATQFLRSGGEVAVISTAAFAARTLEPAGHATRNGTDTGRGTRIVATRRAARSTS
ncbi:MAG: carbamate kinase [Actinophytocola sp.]|uniref:amino acid kinase family protein n=1 Tax=Actinophytocola sp. TaxID=1872138 RepID=UPI0013267876|nr:carbamate kinase [Actinophytocola sp.]MPZ78923.1 carbamate kinase [Actinophytocola sp.]